MGEMGQVPLDTCVPDVVWTTPSRPVMSDSLGFGLQAAGTVMQAEREFGRGCSHSTGEETEP